MGLSIEFTTISCRTISKLLQFSALQKPIIFIREQKPGGATQASSSSSHVPHVKQEHLDVKTVNQEYNTLSVDSKGRSFTSQSSSGSFTYHMTMAAYNLDKPATPSVPVQRGDIYIHVNTEPPESRQVWLFNKHKTWEDISDSWEDGDLIVHPEFSDRVLNIRADQTPNWILRSSLKSNRAKSASVNMG